MNKKFSKLLIILLFAYPIFCGLCNVYEHKKNVYKDKEYLQKNRNDLIKFAKDKIKNRCNLFLWYPENIRTNLSLEIDAAFLHYLLYPSKISYLNEKNFIEADYIIAEKPFDYFVRQELRYNDFKDNLKESSINKKINIYKVEND